MRSCGEVVDEREVRRRVEQALRLVLAVHRRRGAAPGRAARPRDDRAVGRRAPLAVRLQLAPEHELVAVLGQRALFQQGAGVLQLEDGLDGRSLLARPDEIGRGALAEDEAQGIDQDRLAGAGLAGEQGQAGSERQLERGDERDVVYFQQLEHVVGGRSQNITALDSL
jgi:hypothetical protein